MTSADPFASIADLDFHPQCQRVWCGNRCDAPAAAWILFHSVGRCNHPSMDNGRISLLVCADCLLEYDKRAGTVVREMKPPWYRRDKRAKCPSCSKRIDSDRDVLEVIYPLQEGFK